jgi:uncharacterized protein YcfL
MVKLKLGISFMLVFFAVACSRAPKGIISERKMQQLLTDMHLADAIISSDPYTFQNDEDKKALYQSVFEKHRVTQAVYDSSLVWYGKNLDVYMQVYNMALIDVKKRIEEIGEIEPEKVFMSNADMFDIWSIGKYHEFYPSSLSNNLIFNFIPEEDYSSGSIFVLSMQVMGLISGMQSPVEVHLRAEQVDTTILVNKKINNDGFHEMIIRTNPILKVKRVYGYIRFNENAAPYHKIYLNDMSMIKYRYGSEAVAALEGDTAVVNN